MPTIHATQAEVRRWMATGIIPKDAARKPRRAPSCDAPQNGPAGWAVEFIVPWRPVNEANIGGGLRAKIGRKKACKAAVAAALPPYLPPLPVRVTLTRLGGQQRMDDDGLARALKVVQDAVCAALGVDDGDRTKVRIRHHQRPAWGAARVLVRVESA